MGGEVIEPASHQEVKDVKEQLSGFGVKLDNLSTAINAIQNMLSEQKGANVPSRLSTVESKVSILETTQAGRDWIENKVVHLDTEVTNLNYFKYKMVGALILIQLAMTIGGKFALDAIFKASQ